MTSIFSLKKKLEEGGTIAFYDLETTGLNKVNDRILSFSAIKYQVINGKFKAVEKKNLFINPEMDIPKEVSEVNHITNETVMGCPTEGQVAKEIIDFLDSADIVSGYNITKFDDAFINAMSKRVFSMEWKPKEELDVFLMAKEKLSKPDQVADHKLGTVASYFKATDGLEFHNSIDDVLATARIFVKLIALYKTPKITMVALWEKYGINRLYFNNTENIPIYYDFTSKKWEADAHMDIVEDFIKNHGGMDALLNEVNEAGGTLILGGENA